MGEKPQSIYGEKGHAISQCGRLNISDNAIVLYIIVKKLQMMLLMKTIYAI